MKRQGSKTAAKSLRGQPILMLGVLICVWSAMRFATWASPVPEGYGEQPVQPSEIHLRNVTTLTDQRLYMRVPITPIAPSLAPTITPALPPLDGGWNDPALLQRDRPAPLPPLSANDAGPETISPMRMAAGHSLLMAAGFSNMQVPPEIAAFYERALAGGSYAAGEEGSTLASTRTPYAAAGPLASVAGRQSAVSRWSADGWLLWRDDTTTPLTSGRPSYGRSQMGAVVRYELTPRSGHRAQAYLRGSAALQGASEQEVSAGLSARPLARLPIRLAAEMRASDRAEATEVRPAVYAVTELAPQQLPGGLQAEVYVQAGYVGGTYATAFADGQARVDASLASAGDFDLRAGAAAWGGAQEDGERLDVGPSASLTFSMGDARGRLAADYRFRVAGDAQPASGPALTLSAGF